MINRRAWDGKEQKDKQSVYAGSQPGNLWVSVMATGTNHESCEVQIRVTVEEQIILKKAGKTYAICFRGIPDL